MALSIASRFPLGDGTTMPAVGFGTYLVKEEDVEEPVAAALKAGYRHIDTAEVYRNEEGCGRAIAASGLARGDLYITTKLFPGNPDWNSPVKTYDTALAACKASVAKLGVDFVDLYLNHIPLGGGKTGRLEQWRALVECKRLGLATSIGVSNYGVAHLEEIVAAGMELPAANQLELHPHSQKTALIEYMRAKGIHAIAYSSLAPLSNWREGQQGSKTDAARAVPSAAAPVAEAAGKSEAQVLLRWALQKGYSVLPKSTKGERIHANLDVFFELDAAAMSALDAMECDTVYAFGAPGKPLDPTTQP